MIGRRPTFLWRNGGVGGWLGELAGDIQAVGRVVVMTDDENYLYICSLHPGAESASKHLLRFSSPEL